MDSSPPHSTSRSIIGPSLHSATGQVNFFSSLTLFSKYLECMSSLSYRDSSMLRLDPWSLTFVPTQIPKKSKWTNSTLSVDREHPSEGDVLCDLDASGSLSEKAPSADWSQLSPQEKETVTGLEVVEVEAKYREHDALRNLSRQQNVLGLLVIYSLLQFLATLLDKDGSCNDIPLH